MKKNIHEGKVLNSVKVKEESTRSKTGKRSNQLTNGKVEEEEEGKRMN